MHIPSETVTDIAIYGLMTMMFAMGLGLTGADFQRIIQRPWPAAVGLIGQLILLPATAFLIAWALGLPPVIAIGLMIIAACPGGSTSNAFSLMAKGDVALSITLTAVSGMAAFITAPLIATLGVQAFGDADTNIRLSFVDTSLTILRTVALPVTLGMLARRWIKQLPWTKITLVLFGVGLAAVLAPSVHLVLTRQEVLAGYLLPSAMSGIGLNVAMILIGFGFAALCGMRMAQRRTIAIEVGIQNFGLAVVIILQFLGDPRLLAPGLFYLPCMLATGFLMVVWSRWRDKRERATAVEQTPAA